MDKRMDGSKCRLDSGGDQIEAESDTR